VNERKKARNSGFQLIVISHDNEFIDDLARLTEVPDYFRVKKHEETQYSEVEVFGVNDL
jgi:DNA repair exonuclease SbcCD ATPase subunit